MTIGEVKLSAIRKMFANETPVDISNLPSMYTQEEYNLYLNSMPNAINEAINNLLSVKPLIKSFVIDTTTQREEEFNTYRYNLRDLISDYKRISADTNYINLNGDMYCNYEVEANEYFIVPKFDEGNWIVYYEAYRPIITLTTSDEEEIGIGTDLEVLIPLYLAGELYKDDDLSLATMYMNEFLNGIQSLRGTITPKSQERVLNVYGNEVF